MWCVGFYVKTYGTFFRRKKCKVRFERGLGKTFWR